METNLISRIDLAAGNDSAARDITTLIELVYTESTDKIVYEGVVNVDQIMGVSDFYLWDHRCIDSKTLFFNLLGKKVRVTIEQLDDAAALTKSPEYRR